MVFSVSTLVAQFWFIQDDILLPEEKLHKHIKDTYKKFPKITIQILVKIPYINLQLKETPVLVKKSSYIFLFRKSFLVGPSPRGQ